MALSLKNRFLDFWQDNPAISLKLSEETVIFKNGKTESFCIDEWPIFLFLKGEQFSEIIFRTDQARLIDEWSQRIDHYQQLYIEDPEYAGLEEREWNEYDDGGNLVIECKSLEISAQKKPRKRKMIHVPPMEAPLRIDPAAILAIKKEIEEQNTQATLQRMISILNEFRRDSISEVSVKWSLLVGDIIATSLENGALDIARQIAEDHRDKLSSVWLDTSRRLRLLSAYDPKANEIADWARVFESCPLDTLVHTLEKNLSSSAGPQLIKLMSFRTKTHTEELIQYTLLAEVKMQKLMLQWLSPYWQPKHYTLLFKALLTSLKNEELEMIPLWVSALIRSSPGEAFSNIETIFQTKSFLNRLVGRSSQFTGRSLKSLLGGIEENVTVGSLSFLKRLRPKIEGDLADHVEKMINSLHRRSEK